MWIHIHEECWPYLGLPGRFRALEDGMLFECYLLVRLHMLCFYKAAETSSQEIRWRSIGLRCVMYIDDEINAASSEHKCRSDTAVIVSDLQRAGSVLNVT